MKILVTFLATLLILSCTRKTRSRSSHYLVGDPAGQQAQAESEILPIRSLESLDLTEFGGQREIFYRVQNAQVVVADYELIKKDFSSLKNKSNQQIDQWLIQRSAAVSLHQLQHSQDKTLTKKVSSEIEVTDKKILGIRPSEYHRAAVFESRNFASDGPMELIDAKGVGMSPAYLPAPRSHGNGLLSLSQAIREFAMEKLLHMIFNFVPHLDLFSEDDRDFLKERFNSQDYRSILNTKMRQNTIGSYAVLDLGFNVYFYAAEDTIDVVKLPLKSEPAGVILRQAHGRISNDEFRLKRVHVAAILRKFGVSLNDYIKKDLGPNVFESIVKMCGNKGDKTGIANELLNAKNLFAFSNIQMSRGGAVVDFGTLMVQGQFSLPTCLSGVQSISSYTPQTSFGFLKHSELFPVQNLIPPLNDWGVGSEIHPAFDVPSKWAEKYAEEFRNFDSPDKTKVRSNIISEIGLRLKRYQTILNTQTSGLSSKELEDISWWKNQISN